MLKHAFVSAAADGSDATLVRPSNWNEDHVFDGGSDGDLLIRDTGSASGVAWSSVLDLTATNAGGAGIFVGNGGNRVGAITISILDIGTDTPHEMGSSLALVNPRAATALTAAQNPPPVYYRSEVWNPATLHSDIYEMMAEFNATNSTNGAAKWYFSNKSDMSDPFRFTNNEAFPQPAMFLRSNGELMIQGSLLTSGDVRIAQDHYVYGANRAQIGFLADGALTVSPYAATAGVVLDVNVADTVKVKNFANSGYGAVDAGSYKVGGVAGASKSAGPVTSITVVNGIVTACA